MFRGKYVSELAGVIVGSVVLIIIVIVIFGVLRGGMSAVKRNKVCVAQFSFLKFQGKKYMSVDWLLQSICCFISITSARKKKTGNISYFPVCLSVNCQH